MKKNWKRNINNTLENIVELHFTHTKKVKIKNVNFYLGKRLFYVLEDWEDQTLAEISK